MSDGLVYLADTNAGTAKVVFDCETIVLQSGSVRGATSDGRPYRDSNTPTANVPGLVKI